MIEQQPAAFTSEDQQTWKTILSLHREKRDRQVCDIFLKGLKILNISEDQIADLKQINRALLQQTGFQGVFVAGLEEGGSFFRLLADRKFPVGNFIRSNKDLSYTPAPDIVHDLYGHLPFFADKAYADFCQQFGILACKYIDSPSILRQFERIFWFTIEFGLIETPTGRRIFGAGIASSTAECEYALSDKPEVVPFDLETVRHHEFRIDIIQPKLFCLKNTDQLYNCLPELQRMIENDFH